MDISTLDFNAYWLGIGIALIFLATIPIIFLIKAKKEKQLQKKILEDKSDQSVSVSDLISTQDRKSVEKEKSEIEGETKDSVESVAEKFSPPAVERTPWIERLQKGLSRSRAEVWSKLENIIGGNGSELSANALEELEEVLYSADIGPVMVTDLMKELKQKAVKDFSINDLKVFLFNYLESKMKPIQEKVDLNLYQYIPQVDTSKKNVPKVIMVVGVNGAGKTTTIGKLATKLTGQGARVVVGACDTFRAAAVDQLEIWCSRAGAEMVRAKEGADPSGVAFEAVKFAKESGADYCILDTAGRIHTKTNLMEELKKGKRVLGKVDEAYPHQVLLVLDAVTGQNAINQAREFHKALEVTGLVFTKCDGSSKAGNAVSIVQHLNIPIVYIGVGEEVEDLNIFNLKDYLEVLLNFKLNPE